MFVELELCSDFIYNVCLRNTQFYEKLGEILLKIYTWLYVKYRYDCRILMKLEFSRRIFEKYCNIKFHDSSSCGSRVAPCGQKDGQPDLLKLRVAFRNFAKAPKENGVQISL
jgi:hypothetical protein